MARTKGKGLNHHGDDGEAQGIARRRDSSTPSLPSASTVRIADIKIGQRHRKDMGDIAALAASMAELELLHPVVITPDGQLIAGERRLRAAESLGWTEIPVTIIDLDSVVRGEFAENTCRKDFTESPRRIDGWHQRPGRRRGLQHRSAIRRAARRDPQGAHARCSGPRLRAARRCARRHR
jgi:hypothetical protein